MTQSITRFTLLLSLCSAGLANTIYFTTSATSGSCFVTTYNDASSSCQGVPFTATFTNNQGDSALIQWTGATISVNNVSSQPVSYGSFQVSYTSAQEASPAPVTIPQESFDLVVKEFSPATYFYQPFLLNLTGAAGGSGLVGPGGSVDLQLVFSPTSLTNGLDTTLFVPASATSVVSGANNVAGSVVFAASTPEPSTWLLAGTAVFLLAGRYRAKLFTR